MIIIDFSNVVKGILIEFVPQLKTSSEAQVENIVRHVLLNTIKSYKKKWPEYGDKIIICCDSSDCWRRDSFPQYKYKRAEAQKASDVDWDFIYRVSNSLAEEIKAFLPWQVIKVARTEADDIIGVLVKHISENETDNVGLFGEPPKILLISGDKDFKYLNKYSNFKQWSPTLKKYVELEGSPVEFLRELIGRGDSGDGIPCILADDNHFVDGTKRQPSMFADFVAEIRALGREACKDDLQRQRWDRNKKLIDLSETPQVYVDKIMHEYHNTLPSRNKNILLSYLVDKRLNQLINAIPEFY